MNATDYCGESALIYTTKPHDARIDEEVQVRIAKLLLENEVEKV